MKEPTALPVPRRCFSHEEAAAYCGMSVSAFDDQVKAGIFPRSLTVVGRRRIWDRLALDRALDAMSGLSAEAQSADRKQKALEKILSRI